MRKIGLFVLAAIMAVAFMPAAAFAEEAPEMTAYDQVIKEGGTVYCSGAAGIYKVKVKANGKVKSKKRIFKSYPPFGKYSYVSDMYKQDNYIYFLLGTEGACWYLKRVSTSGAKRNLVTLNDTYYGYSIDGNTIYYSTYIDAYDDYDYDDEDYDDYDYDDYDYDDYDDEDYDDEDWAQYQTLMRMNLDGTSKQETDVTPNLKSVKSNATGYSRVIKKKGKYLRDYLKTPKGTYYLGKIKIGY